MSKVREIYRNMVQGRPYMNEITIETENQILELIKSESQKEQEEYEQYRDRLYSAAAIAEEGGFIKGFCYAVELMEECRLERYLKTWHL